MVRYYINRNIAIIRLWELLSQAYLQQNKIP